MHLGPTLSEETHPELKDSGCVSSLNVVSYSLIILEVFSRVFLLRISENEGSQNIHGPAVITWPISCQVNCGPVIQEEL